MKTQTIEQRRENRTGRLLLFITAVLWGGSFIVAKAAVAVVPPDLLVAFRFSGGCALLCLVFAKKLRTMTAGCFRAGFLIGIIVFVSYYLQTAGLAGTTPGRNAFLTAVYVVLVPFMAWAFFRRRPDVWSFAAAALALLGIALISLDGSFRMSPGDALSLASGLGYAAQVIAIEAYAKDHDPVLLAIVQIGTCGALAWIVYPFTGESWPVFTPAVLWSLAALAFLISGMCTLFQNVGQSKIRSASAAALILSLESVFGAAFSVLFYGEVLTPRLAAGFAVVFFAILISQTKLSFLRPGRRRKA